MQIAIISDIHSNIFALKAVFEEMSYEYISDIIILGDIFGYYPWASETYRLLMTKNIIAAIKGNHDEIVLEDDSENKSKHLEYYILARHNRNDLITNNPESINWLSNLKLTDSMILWSKNIILCHGTPDNNSCGRYYPDDNKIYDWFPKQNEILFLGHTHYPLKRQLNNGEIIFNPGSVGQPRDGNTMASWGIWNVINNSFELKRTFYNNKKVIDLLQKQNWDKRSILALEKDYSGNLKL